jgi:hypothetical protein
MSPAVTILTPAGMLGYGIPAEWFRKGVAMKPDIITVDSGSTDSGPQKLGLGDMTATREAYVKDISLMLEACSETKTPVVISSAGGDGTKRHVDDFVEIVREIAKERGYRFKLATIDGDVSKDVVKAGMKAGRVSPLGPVPTLLETEVEAATSIVAQMGAEPFMKVFREQPDIDIIISGRSYDPSPIAAAGLLKGIDPALCWHIGKIMECGAVCATPQGKNIIGTLDETGFELEPLNPAERCTRRSVAAHTLYEKSHPFLLPGPGGTLDLSGCTYDQLSDRRVRVAGAQFIESPRYTVKLEGAKKVGYRTIFIAGIRDPILIGGIDAALDAVRLDTAAFFSEIPPESYEMVFHVYGKNGVMGDLEPIRDANPHELCVILEVAAPTQKLATAICNKARTRLMHFPYPGKITAGNLASPFTPLEIPLGEVCEFNIYHLLEIDSPVDLFPIEYLEI